MEEKKVVFFGGKGGVGKTTVSSAFSLMLTQEGKKVLLISTDPAHSLSDIFDTEVSNLDLLEIQPERVVREYVERAIEVVSRVMSPDTVREVEEVFRSVEETPGAEESAVVEELSKVILSRWEEYDHFVIDTAPTGHTLQMIRTVSKVGPWLEELIRRRKKASSFWEASGRRKEDRVVEVLEERRTRLTKFAQLIFSHLTTFVPVLNPERLPIEETVRMLKALKGLHLGVDFMVINKVLPEGVREEFFLRRKRQEEEYLREIEERFRGVKKVRLHLRDRDVRGVQALKEIAQELKEGLKG